MLENFLKPLTKWDYSSLVKNAKLFGGPRKYVQAIFDYGLRVGRVEMLVELKNAGLLSGQITK